MDAKGRVSLGEKFANRRVIVVEEKDKVTIIRAAVVPEHEAWLYKNPEALAAVARGLHQARALRFAEGPDLDRGRKLADQIEG